MPPVLAAYLRDAARTPFVWGELDCVTFLADWLVCATGLPDPAAQWRGRYANEPEAAAVCGRCGAPGVIARGARAAGLPRTRDPLPGDIGVVVIGRAVGAIRTPAGWAARLSCGIAVARNPRVVASWSLPCHRP
jgi:hypothetical protein